MRINAISSVCRQGSKRGIPCQQDCAMARRISAGRIEQGEARPIRLRTITCKPERKAGARLGDGGAGLAFCAAHELGGGGLTNGASVWAQAQRSDCAGCIGFERQIERAAATAGAGRAGVGQIIAPGEGGKLHRCGQHFRRVEPPSRVRDTRAQFNRPALVCGPWCGPPHALGLRPARAVRRSA